MSIYGNRISELLEMANDYRGCNSQVERLYIHLLKFKYQPSRQGRSWIDTIYDSINQINDFIGAKTNNRKMILDPENIETCYKHALVSVKKETKGNVDPKVFPIEILDEMKFEKIIDLEYTKNYLLSLSIKDSVSETILNKFD